MAKITTAQFKKGLFILYKNQPYQMVEYNHVNPGKGAAFLRTKLKNVKTGRVLEVTFKSGESAEAVNVSTKELQYLYSETTQFHFMDNSTYEQTTISKNTLGNYSKYLKEGKTYQFILYGGEVIGTRFPKKVTLAVTHTEPAVRGNTVSGGALKPATMETGAIVNVPLFIKIGEKIAVDTEAGTYVERAR